MIFIEIVRNLILAAALAHGVNAHLMDKIAFCESTYGTHSSNLYQLMPGGELNEFYRRGYNDINDPSQQANFVAERLAEGYLSPWYASRNCWIRFV